MVLVEDSRSSTRFPLTPNYYSQSTTRTHRNVGRSMRTIRSRIFDNDRDDNNSTTFVSENLTDSVVDMRLGELAAKPRQSSCSEDDHFLELSQSFSDFSTCSSDISGELQCLACLPSPDNVDNRLALFLRYLTKKALC